MGDGGERLQEDGRRRRRGELRAATLGQKEVNSKMITITAFISYIRTGDDLCKEIRLNNDVDEYDG